jgi:TIR domain
VKALVQGLRMLHHEVWLDEELSGGQAWWDVILKRIRDCDAMLVVLSPAALDSQACEREREYGAALGKPLLPVMIEQLSPDLLSPELAALQFVDYTTTDQEAAFRLAGAVSALSPAAPLPNPLPPPPPVPLSYLSDLSKKVQASTLTLDEQLALAGRLRAALERQEHRNAAVVLLQRLQERHDLYYAVAKELEQLQQVLQSSSHSIAQVTPSDSPERGVERTENKRRAESSEAEQAAAEWKVAIKQKESEHRTLTISRKSTNTVSYVCQSEGLGWYETLSLNGQTVQQTKKSDAFRDFFDFTIVDGDETINVRILIKRNWLGNIKSFGLKIEEQLLYSDTGP